MLMSVKDSGCFRAALPANLLFADSWIFMSFIFTPQLCNFGVYAPISIVFPFVGVFLRVRGKAYSEEYVSRHVSTFARDIKHMDDTLPNLVRGRSER